MSRPKLPLPALGPLFDSHCHLSWIVEGDPTADRLQRAREAGVQAMITVAIDLDTAEEARQLAAANHDVFPTIGLHPTDVPSGPALASTLESLREQAAHADWVAIGETGLDLFHQRSELRAQRESLEVHLELSAAHGLPVILHCRQAIEELLPVLRTAGSVQGVMHCYSEGPDAIEELLGLGLHVSFAGNLSYPKSEALREAARLVPIDRLLIETDAPFLAPQPRRGKRNEPAFVAFTAETLAGLQEITGEELAAQTFANGCRLFQLPQEELRQGRA